MEFSPSDFGKWMQSRLKEVTKLEYDAKTEVDRAYFKGQKDAFFECYQMLMGEGDCWVCGCGRKGPYKDLKECNWATLIRSELKKHLLTHHIQYKTDEEYDRFHKFVMKEA